MTRARLGLISLLGALGAVACGSGDTRDEENYGAAAGVPQGTGGSEQGTGGSSEGGSGNSTAEPAGGTTDGGSPGEPSQAGDPGVLPTAGAAGAVEAAGGAGGAGGAPGEPSCATTADCTDGQVCAEYRIDGAFYCKDPPETGAEMGEECTSTNLVSDECTTGLCLDFNHRCSELCTADADCDTAEGFVCIDFGIGAFCVAGCGRTADCPEGQVCRIAGNADNTNYHWACSVPAGTIEAGEAPEGGDCTGENGCVNALCLSASSAEGEVTDFCTEPCESATDCPEGLPTCGEVQMGSATTPVSACTP